MDPSISSWAKKGGRCGVIKPILTDLKDRVKDGICIIPTGDGTPCGTRLEDHFDPSTDSCG